MKEFADIASFMRFMGGVASQVDHARQIGLKEASVIVEEAAKAEIGHYQGEAGPFPAWAELSDATLYGFRHVYGFKIEGKIDAGYATESEHRPLERTGQMRDSIGTKIAPGEAVVGSDDDILIYQEMGTPNAIYPIPPRPVLGPAAFRNEGQAVDAMTSEVAMTIAGVPLNGPRKLIKSIFGE